MGAEEFDNLSGRQFEARPATRTCGGSVPRPRPRPKPPFALSASFGVDVGNGASRVAGGSTAVGSGATFDSFMGGVWWV